MEDLKTEKEVTEFQILTTTKLIEYLEKEGPENKVIEGLLESTRGLKKLIVDRIQWGLIQELKPKVMEIFELDPSVKQIAFDIPDTYQPVDLRSIIVHMKSKKAKK